MNIDIEKVFSEIGRLHIQITLLSEENAKLRKELEDAKLLCKPASASE